MRGRKPEPDGKRVTICAKVSEPVAAAIDRARGEASRSAWLQEAITAKLAAEGQPPQRAVFASPKHAPKPKACKHPKVRGKGVCPDCHEWVASK